MNHLRQINKTYFQHFALAIYNSIRLMYASIILVLHAFLPFTFESTASDIIKDIVSSIPKNKREVLVRFNTKWRDDPAKRQWRVLVDDKETLVHKVIIKTLAETIEKPINNEQKFHFLINGNLEWNITEDQTTVTVI